jgi:CRISPR-associated endonuclease/helicase Cas3
MIHYAHTKNDPVTKEPLPQSEWERLFTPFSEGVDQCQKFDCKKCEVLDPKHGHLNKVAYWSAKFAEQMFPCGSSESEAAREWGWLAGLWHDLGKFAPEWQSYLAKKTDIHSDEVSGTVDHSTGGAVLSEAMKPLGPLMSYTIAGHHAGLADGTKLFHERLKKNLCEWRPAAEVAGIPLELPIPAPPLLRKGAGNDAMAFMIRFFFSCLVDADFLATEAFMNPQQGELREPWPEDILDRMIAALESYLVSKFPQSAQSDTLVNRARNEVQGACASAANERPGFFSLTVPTGGGKTLSSLLFALRHAKANDKRRAIFVIPFTSIIKQNADVFREVFADLSKELGRDIVLEHHSKFDPNKETTTNRLASENWDAPLIVTTNVQFFESLFANRTGACRKLHRIARSVIVFDEVQALPNHLYAPILRGLRCLVKDLRTTAVLCTATQPALERRDDFHIGIPSDEIYPIIKDEQTLFSVLKRVESHYLGAIDDVSLIDHVLEHADKGCLLVLNTTKAAQTLFEKLGERTNALHLSARMCPAHVIAALKQAKALREAGESVVLISTQLIEAGVDISFPVVYRAECGLDSFAQAAGRCNRHGELVDQEGQAVPGRVYFFEPTDHPIPKALAELVSSAAISRAHIIPNFDAGDLLSLEAIRAYFEQAIWQAGPRTDQWDKPHIVSGDMPCFAPESNTLTSYNFKTAAERFSLIPSITHSVIIPWGDEGEVLVEEIRNLNQFKLAPNRKHYRRAQQFSVQIYEHEWQKIQDKLSFYCDEAFAVLTHPKNDYHKHTGIKRPDAADDPSAFML